jgi:hypothetical protein
MLSAPLHAAPLSDPKAVAKHLRETVAGTTLPLRVSDTTVLVAAESNGNTLRYTYHFDDGSPEPLSADYMRPFLAKANCADEYVRTLLKAGAFFEFHYLGPGGDVGPGGALISIDWTDCKELLDAR